MSAIRSTRRRRGLRTGAAVIALLVAGVPTVAAAAQTMHFGIRAQPLDTALREFGTQSGLTILVDAQLTRGKSSAGYIAVADPETALRALLSDTGLTFRRSDNVFVVVRASAGPNAAGAQADAGAPQDEPAPTADIVVTAQKREQRIQDVPIAISAFSGRTLDAMKIETGGDLLKSIPNVTFSKNNFAGYNFAIRGIGTKAVAASTDPAVAVAFNSSNLIVNRLFEQEFYDIERVEVLRGPQGTLYGRNATAGVVNIISKKANLTRPEGFVKLEEGNYETARVSGAFNFPIIADKLAIRAAGAYTSRDGFAKNDYYGTRIDGRNLWSTRLTLSAKPFDALDVDLIWERFQEDDDRQRTGKQLCHKDPGPSQIAGVPLTTGFAFDPLFQGQFSQGCRDGSLYDDAAYSTPNGLSLNAFQALNTLAGADTIIRDPDTGASVDPYGGVEQSRDLRRYSAIINPRYRTKADVFEANVAVDFGRASLVSQTLYNRDRYYSTQDYSRYVSNPIFRDYRGLPQFPGYLIAPDGVFDDPQLGPSNRLLAGDLIRAKSRQFSQELRLQSADPSSRLQYVIGVNYTRFKLDADYNVFINTLTYLTQVTSNNLFLFGQLGSCLEPAGTTRPGQFTPGCVYTDNNPLGVGPGDGHNYFRSINPYRLTSWGAFGDINYALTPDLKIIAGLRENVDKKRFDQVPSQLLLGTGTIGPFGELVGVNASLAGFVDRGYPKVGQIDQKWSRLTGRAGFQWTPDVSFSDKTMAYATFSRGYKAGGANPPGPGFGTLEGGYGASTTARGQVLTQTFRPEYINSYEVGVKNTLFGGAVTFDATGFFYDYQDYQVSQIIDRSSQNENFDATVWGLEFELVANPTRAIAVNANLGYQRSRIKGGQRSIDVMNRTQGREGYYVVKPFAQLPSNCVVNEAVILKSAELGSPDTQNFGFTICQGSGFSDTRLANLANYAPGTTLDDLFPNNGNGFYAPLGGNELPNTPHLTLNVGAQYTIPLGDDWGVIARGDVYHQSESYARVYNTIGDRLHGWENVNASLRVGNERYKFLAEIYVKNVFDSTPITDAFINSDDTGLTTNVFTLDPRIVGISVTKGF